MHASNLIKSLYLPVHPSWESFLTANTHSKLMEIESQILLDKPDLTPALSHQLRFLTLDLNHVKVIILGQDPYPQPGAATGRAFEVGTLKSWKNPFKNVSLKNIVRAIYSAEKSQIVSYNNIKEKLNSDFKLLEPNLLFQDWENQGVLLLNTAFSTKIGFKNKHSKIWEPFTQDLIRFISDKYPAIQWFLWGDHARKYADRYPINAFCSTHPMMCVQNRKDDFLYGEINCFYQTRNLIHWTGIR